MTAPNHASYRLTRVRDEHLVWYSVIDGLDVRLQFGRRFGMLHSRLECPCCQAVTTHVMFFGTNAFDPVMRTMNFRQHRRRMYDAWLPDGTFGRFRHDHTSPDFDDAYILRHLVMANESETKSSNLAYFFDRVMAVAISKRAAFKRLAAVSRRERKTPSRMMALHVLDRRGVDEETLRLLIVRMAGLW